MTATYIVIKRESEMTASDEDFACDIYEKGGIENFLVEVMNALVDKNINWSAYQIQHVKEAIEQVMKEQGERG